MSKNIVKICAVQPPMVAPDVALADVFASMIEDAAAQGAHLVVFPELSLVKNVSHEQMLEDECLGRAQDELISLCEQTAHLDCAIVIGLPVCHEGKLYDCAAVLQSGTVLGLVPKTHIPKNLQNAYFATPPTANLTYQIGCNYIQMGVKQIFVDTIMPNFRFCLEIGEDAYTMIPPSTYATMAGATVICHVTRQTVDETDQTLLLAQSRRTTSACVSVPAEGRPLLAQDGLLIDMTYGEIDLDMLSYERRRRDTFRNDTAGEYTEVYFCSNQEIKMLTESDFV